VTYLAADVRVWFAFGVNATGDCQSPDAWTEVTDWLNLDASSPALTMASGRGSVRGGIEPGSLTFELDNSDRRFDPRNADGPYSGFLKNHVPVRVTTVYNNETVSRWTGFVTSGWPQDITQRNPVVSITATDVFGFIANADAPISAFDAAVRQLPVRPDQWWRIGPTGWSDGYSSKGARHTGGITEAEEITDGEGGTFGQSDPDGYAQIDPEFSVSTKDRWVVHARFRADAEKAEFRFPSNDTDTNQWYAFPVYAVDHEWYDSGNDRRFGWPLLQVLLIPGGVAVVQYNPDNGRGRIWNTPQVMQFEYRGGLWDGKPHSIVVAGRGVGGLTTVRPEVPALWIDGERIGPFTKADVAEGAQGASSNVSATADLDAVSTENRGAAIGGSRRGFQDFTNAIGGAKISGRWPYVGAIDNVLVWRNHPGTTTEIGQMARSLWESAQLAWVGQTLDQRLRAIVEAIGMEHYLGDVDQSGVVTLQGYRQDEPLSLLQTIADTEQGAIRANGCGRLFFQNRQWSWEKNRSKNVQLTFSDDDDLLEPQAPTPDQLNEGFNGPNGVNITPVNTAATQVVAPTDVTIQFDTSDKVQGSAAMRLVATNAGNGRWRGTLDTSARYVSFYIKWDTTIASGRRAVWMAGNNSGLILNLFARSGDTWQVRIHQNESTEVVMPRLPGWTRVDVEVNAPAQTARFRFFGGDTLHSFRPGDAYADSGTLSWATLFPTRVTFTYFDFTANTGWGGDYDFLVDQLRVSSTQPAPAAFEMLEAGTTIVDDFRNIVNVAQVNSTFGRQQTYEDAASIAEYGRQSVQLSNLLHPTDAQSMSIARWIVQRQAEPRPMVERVTFLVENDPEFLAPIAQRVNEGWLFRVVKARPGDDNIEFLGHVIGVEHNVSFTGWLVTLTLDPLRAGLSFFRWGVTPWGASDLVWGAGDDWGTEGQTWGMSAQGGQWTF
jgi:hypothetical protein